MRWTTSLLCLVILPGCVERALGEPEGGAIDLARPPGVDLGGGDLAACGNRHSYATVPISEVVTLDGKDTFSPTSALRLLARFAVRDCDVPAELSVEVTPGNATTAIALSAHLWMGTSGCGPAQTATREVTVPAVQNAQVFVRDGTAPSGEPLLFLGAAGDFTPMCVMTAPGDACANDCDCNGADGETLCLVRPDGTRRCGRPCHEDAQCRLNGVASLCAEDTWSCVEAQACRSGSQCPFSETVIDCRCAPPLGIGPAPPQCSCDEECPSGALCGGGSCVQVCTGAHTCATYGAGEGGTACVDGACLQLI